MLKNKIIVRKIRNIVILIMAIIVMVGAYRNIGKSRAEDIIEIEAIAQDNYGYLEDEEFVLEAKDIGNDLYEVQWPESINTKIVEKVHVLSLQDDTVIYDADAIEEIEENEEEIIEVDENEEITGEGIVQVESTEIVEEEKIILTKEQIENKPIKLELNYKMLMMEKDETGQNVKTLLEGLNEENINSLEIKEDTQFLYNKILRYEDEENGKLVQVKGYLPIDAKLQVEEVAKEKITSIFGETKIDVAYDIKIIREVISQVPTDEADPTAQVEEIVEIIEINPEDFGENCEVLIKDANIVENSQVYHVKEDNTYEHILVKENTEENISFDAKKFSIYAVGSEAEGSGEGILPTASNSLYFSPSSTSSYSSSVTVTIGTESSSSNVSGYKWSTSTSTPSSWTSAPSSPMSTTQSTAGTWYLHARDDFGNTSYGGPYYVGSSSGGGGETTTDTQKPQLYVTSHAASYGLIREFNGYNNAGTGVHKSSTTTWTDLKGNANGTLNGSPTWGSDHLVLDGSNDWVNMGQISFSGNAALEVTVALTSIKSGTVYLLGNSESGGIGLGFTDGKPRFIAYVDGAWRAAESTTALTVGTKYHIVGTFDGSYVRLYVNGTLQEKFSASGSLGAPASSTVMALGGDPTGSAITGTYVAAKVYSARIYNQNLTQARVTHNKAVTDAAQKWNTGALSTTIKAVDLGDSGLSSSNSYQYYLSNSSSALSGGSWKNYTSGTAISLNPGTTGKWYLFVKRVKDNAGNTCTINGTATTISSTTYQRFGPYMFDYEGPKITVSPSSKTWTNAAVSTTITVSDGSGSGVATGTYQYYLSNSSTALSGGSWKNYTSGTAVSLNPGTSGTYYLFVKRFTDNVGKTTSANGTATTVSSVTYQRFGSYQFDYTKPTISVSTTSCTWRNSALSTTITAADTGGSGLSSSNSYQYYLSNSSTALSGGSWTNYTSGTAISLNPGTSGTYYLFVKRVSDVAGNTSTANGTATTVSSVTYQRFGAYQFDYVAPTGTGYVISDGTKLGYTNQPTVSSYVKNVADTGGSGFNYSHFTAWYGGGWTTHNSGSTGTLLSGTTYYASWTFANIKHTVSGNTGNGEGKYYFDVHLYDNAGNRRIPGCGQVIYDTTSPTVSVSPATCTWRNTAISTTITLTDPTTNAADGNVSGISDSSTFQYYLSRSATSLTGGSWKTYTAGTAISLEPDDKTYDAEYYLFVKKVQDRAGNLSATGGTLTTIGSTTYHRFGPYQFDYVKPAIQYTHQSIDIDKGNKTYTMTFKGVDNHYSSGVFTLDQLTILMQNGQLDASGNLITYNLKDLANSGDIELSFRADPIGDGTGYTYTLAISNLEKFEIKTGMTTADYSGIITVAVPADVMVDVAGNTNDATTITTGIEIPGGTGSGVPIDVVDPRWDKVSSLVDIDNNVITLTVKGTDTYFHQSTLTNDKVNILINGALVTEGINVSIGEATELTETRKVNGTNTTVQYGVQYTITITGFDTNIEQLKVQLPAGTLIDQNGNTNKTTDFILYNYLKWTGLEKSATSGFLGNTSIQRQNIDTVTFVAGIDDANETQWDASARGDNSIIAWYTTNANGTLKVYIGSEDAIFANRDSSYLFAHIGYGPNCTSTQPITNLGSLVTASVENMTAMFAFTGYRSMTSLDISSLNTKNVTNMREMFNGTGYKNMTSITFGENFDTAKVTDMSWMFANFGYTKMTGLTFPGNFTTASVTDMSYMFANFGYTAATGLSVATFDTTNVTDMSYMFSNCGYTAMTSLTLGSNFNTQSVTDMSHMFASTGYTNLASIDLGSSFNTTNVTDMSGMFENFGYTKLTGLDLGDVFSTSNVTDMTDMFNGCGYTAMTSLDLGQAFTNIASTYTNFVTNTGISGSCIIYAPESIYKTRTSFKLNKTSTAAISYTRGTINPKYKPEWTVTGTTFDTTNKKLNITLTGATNTANYTSNVTTTLAAEDITVWIDGTQLTGIGKSVTTASPATAATVTHTLTLTNFEETLRQVGKLYKEWSGNITLKIAGRGESTSTYGANVLVDSYGNQSMMATDETNGTWVEVNFKDATASNANTNGKLFADFIKPEVAYKYVNTDVNYTAKTVQVVFTIADKYYSSTSTGLTANDLEIFVDAEEVWQAGKINAVLASTDITATVDGVANTVVGKQYTLTISEMAQDVEASGRSYLDYAGIVTVAIPAGKIVDNSGNANIDQTITVGVDLSPEQGGSSSTTSKLVDLVDPKWTVEVGDESSGTVGLKLRAIDEYFKEATLTTDDITVYVNGVANSVITKDLTTIAPVDIKDTVDGVANTVVGKEYTLLLGNLDTGAIQYETFTPINAIVGGTAKYRKDNAGEISIDIAAGTIEDTSGNTNDALEDVELGNYDTTQLEVFKVQSSKDTTNKTETIIFNVTDKNYFTTDKVTQDEIQIYVDNVLQTSNINIQSLTDVEIITTVDGVQKVVGHQYTLVLNGIDETNAEYIASGRDYRELSGTISIKIDADASKDTNGNTIDPTTTTVVGDYVDFIAPEIKYTHQASDIQTGNKKYVMTFNITDKYYSTGVLTLNDITTTGKIEILMQNGQLDASGNPIVYNLKDEPVTIALLSTPIEKTFNKTVSGSVVSGTYTIGHTYTLTISNLEQLEIKTGMTTADYSGIITVSIDGAMITDEASNSNAAKTITAGVNIHGGTESGTPVEVDVVDPLWERVSSSALAKSSTDAVNATATTGTSTITVKGTDTYLDVTDSTNSYDDSTLTSDEIEVYVDGVKDTSITPVVGTVTSLTETRRVYNSATTETVQYGVQYTITVNGWAQGAKQVKIRILEDAIKDETGNGNKATDLIIYNCLESAATETAETSGFLDGNGVGESGATTGIQRNQIQQVIFVDSLDGSTAAGVKKVWDVSAMTDGSIKAWTSQTAAPYTVYIGSDFEIFGNQDSSNLFSYIGFAGDDEDGDGTIEASETYYTATATETISNIEALNVASVTIMYNMFNRTGYTAMTSLDLGDEFDTSNVYNMNSMFYGCGYTAMVTLDLGTQFDTSKVISMNNMFAECGYTAMTSLNLATSVAENGSTVTINFDTSNVGDMESMFYKCGYTAMTGINFGSKFDTSNVTTMKDMFSECGFTAMQSLNLGAEGITFNTAKVTNMWGMFYRCGYTAMHTLDLGDQFDTSLVTDMHNMFRECGFKELLILDLTSGTTAANTTQFNTSSVRDMVQVFQYLGNDKMHTLNLGHNFNTSSATNMQGMFADCGNKALTSLDLGDKFYTTNATNMQWMFTNTGATSMTTLDLGPAFTRICSSYTSIFANTGKSGACTIYSPEAIYKSRTSFKLNSTDTATTISYANGTINPKYKPEWSVTGTTVTNSGSTQKIDITLAGAVNTANYTSDVTTTLAAEDITVWIDGTQLTDVGIAVSTASPATGATISHTVTLTNFEEALRQAGKLYKEWSGNITLRIAGRGEATTTYGANVLYDSYGNQSMMATDEVNGTWVNVEFKDETTSSTNTNGKLFADFIKPEVVYTYSDTDINYTAKTVQVVFTIADKYYASENLTVDELTIFVDDVLPGDTNGNGVLDAGETFAMSKTLTSTDIKATVDGVANTVIGKQYTLIISEMAQDVEASGRSYLDYAGVVTIAIPAGQVTDNSGNSNVDKTITIGVDLSPEEGAEEEPVVTLPSTEYTTPYLPTGFTHVTGTDLSNGLTIQDGSGNQYVWVEVPRNSTVYDEVGTDLDLESLSETDLTTKLGEIETELQEYATDYREEGYSDTYSSADATGIADEATYNSLKQTMLKSVYENGGFYIGKYETGTATARTSKYGELPTAVVQANAYPYNFVTNKQAQELASGMASGDYTSSLMFGIQWDLVLKYLETKGATQEELKGTTTGSTNWGNYKDSTYNITNTSAKYADDGTSSWYDGAFGEKVPTTSVYGVLLSTGADSQFSKMGIYDFAGNVNEWTLESYSDASEPCTYRGGGFNLNGTDQPASYRKNDESSYAVRQLGFRVALYANVSLDSDSNEPKIVDIVDPKWSIVEPDDNTSETVQIKLRAIDEYFKEATLTADDITVYVNGVASSTVVKDITTIPPVDIKDTVDGVANTVVGKEYTLKLSNLEPGEVSYTTFVPTNLNQLDEPTRGTYEYKYKTENGGTVTLEIAAGTIEDKSGNKNGVATLQAGNIDATNPGIYEVRKTQDASGNTETIVFNVTDKNFDKTDLITKSEMAIFMDNNQIDSLLNDATLSTPIEIKATVDGTEKVVGHQYTLVVNNIAETTKRTGKDYLEWSGTLRLDINAGAAKDLAGNNSDAATITDFVDYVKPQLEQVTVTNPIDTSAKTYTMSFKIIDKYFDTTNALEASEIKVYIDGELDGDTDKDGVLETGETPTITKTLTSSAISATMNKTVSGAVTNGTYTIGHTYTLVLSGFEQSSKQDGKDFMEWSGTVKIVIDTDAVNDTTGNTLDADVTKRTVNGEHVDFIKPVVEEVEPTATIIAEDTANKTETIVFNIMDKYLDTTNALETSEITVYVDGEAVTVDYTNASSTGLDGVLTKVQDFRYTVNGDASHVVGQQYKLVLSNFDQITRNSKEYKDYSGTVSIELATNAVDDTSNNLLDASLRTVTGDFVDYIKPDIEYTHQTSDVDTGNKQYTMTFDITDKYYSSGVLTLADITTNDKIEILMQNGQVDSSGNPIVYNLKDEPVTIALSATPITKTFNKTVGGTVVTGGTYTIGHTYTLTISNLEKLEIKTGLTTADYSGIITVSIDGEMITDTSNNGNAAETITSGVNIAGGTESGTPVEVDVVDPIWNKVSSSAYAFNPADKTKSIATVTIKGTDTYLDVTDTTNSYDDSTLTTDEIEVYIDGTKVTSITPSISTVTPLEEERRVYDSATNETVQYGVEYTITLNGWSQTAKQVKIKILEDAIKDETGNGNKDTDIIIYNCLESAATETAETSGFLDGNGAGETAPTTGIQRNQIQQVIFVNSLAGSTAEGVQKVWDVSAVSDGSIKAWTSQTATPYTVYVGSDDEIFANQDASYLFAYIGFAGDDEDGDGTIEASETYYTPTTTDTISNLGALNVSSVTNMAHMFRYAGFTAMITLDLGSNFDTSNVTNMDHMFRNTGYVAMTTFSIGSNFDTSNVTTMRGMFFSTGYMKMTSLALGSKFDTGKVTDMYTMFDQCGYKSMTSLDIGDNFDTRQVDEMSYMFRRTGYEKLGSLDLTSGTANTNTNQFNTSGVGNMDNMFAECGYKLMTSFNLGYNFDTGNVTQMSYMFANCGHDNLEVLDLGNKFNTTNVKEMDRMFLRCGEVKLKSLDLGELFNTAKVETMYRMFMYCGYTKLTSLDLGDQFYTTVVTTTEEMFNNCGTTAMTILDLGPAFTRIPATNTNMFTNCGTTNLKVYAPESIYSDRTSLKLNN